MPEFKGFSEAARLYAENADVVDLMWKAMMESIRAFLGGLSDEVRRHIPQRQLETYDSARDGYFYWNITELAGAPVRNPRCFCKLDAPRIVVPGEIRLGLGSRKQDIAEPIRSRIVALRQDPSLKPYVVKAAGDSWSLLAVKVPYGGADAVATVAPVLSALLLKSTEAAEGKATGLAD